MLFTYSKSSLAHNWLSVVIVKVLDQGMESIINATAPLDWPLNIPEPYRAVIETRTGVKERLEKFWKMFAALSLSNKKKLLQTLRQQTAIPALLNNMNQCNTIDIFPSRAKKVTVELFRFLFEKQLNSLKQNGTILRDLHYKNIYDAFPDRVCPFCGLGHFRSPNGPRHALDHYMAITKYPFVGVDLQNLPPICTECNSDFKKDTDILVDDTGTRQPCVDPYDGPAFSVDLSKSVPFAGPIHMGTVLPKWSIGFNGGPPAHANNWDRVFKIRKRYEDDILNVEYRKWLDHFARWYRGSHGDQIDQSQLVQEIENYVKNVIQDGFADKAFLKAEVFRLIAAECKSAHGSVDMRAFLQILVTNA